MAQLPITTPPAGEPPRLQLVTEAPDEGCTTALAVDPTPEGAVLGLSPVAAVEVALALVKAGTPEQFARMSAAACSTVPDIQARGVQALASLLLRHTHINVDHRDLEALVDQLDDALVIGEHIDPALPDDHADERADSWRDGL